MKRILLHLPLVAGLLCYADTLNAKEEQLKTNSAKPLHFIANAGQVIDQYFNSRGDIDFKLAAGNGLNIFIGAGKIEYQWVTPKEIASPHSASLHGVRNDLVQEEEGYEMYRMDVRLIGANPRPRILKEDQQAYYERYFLSWVNKDNSNDGVIANAYSKITYKEVYPHIDWVFYFNAKGQLEHDFIVHPGGKVSDIRMRYSGADQLEIDPEGSLVAVTPMGSLKENAPIAYSNQETNIPARFRLQDNHILSFDIASYTGTLVIDPVLEWGTYYGGAGNDECFAITADKWGFVYMAGSTASTDNIATTGAHQTTFGGGTDDAFLSKWAQSGQLLWASYYGGSNVDMAKGAGCDSSGNVYIGGNTNSVAGIATSGIFQEVKRGTTNSFDAFLVKLDSSGQRLWGTYFGGAANDAQTSFALATDQANHVYLTGNTQSTDLPTTSGVHQTALSGGIDVFVAKFNNESNLVWSTFYGGPGADHAMGITVDKEMNVYFTGWTQSLAGISSIGSFQSSLGGGQDAYLTRFSSLGHLSWATYLGGEATDRAYALSVFDENIVIGGVTNSISGLSSPTGFQKSKNTGDDAFIALFDRNGNRKWTTYYGGDGADATLAVRCTNKFIYVFGQTGSKDSIATIASIQKGYNGAIDAFVLKLNLSGERSWASYYGGTSSETAGSLYVSDEFDLYLGGRTNSGEGISFNGHQSQLNAGRDAFLIKINDCDAPGKPVLISGDSIACSGTVHWYQVEADSMAGTYHWLLPVGWEGASDSSRLFLTVGTHDDSIRVYAQSACGANSDTAWLQVTVLPLPTPEIVHHNGILSTNQVYESYQWIRDGVDLEGATSGTYLVDKNGNYSLRVTNTGGCEGLSDTVLIEGVSIREQRAPSGILVYPNPATTGFTLQAASSGVLAIWSIKGHQVLDAVPVHIGLNQVDVRYLPAGMYLLRMTTNKGSFYGKLNKL